MEKAIRQGSSTAGHNIKFRGRSSASWLLFCAFAFFTGRVLVLDSVNPIVIGYLSNFIGKGPLIYVMSAFSTFGLLTNAPGAHLIKYIISMTALCLASSFFTYKKVRVNVMQSAALGGMVIFVSGIFIASINGISVYLTILAAMEGILAFGMTFLLKKGTGVLQKFKSKKALKTEELISLALLLGGVVAGAANIYVGAVSLRIFFVSTIVLIAGHKGGSMIGSSAGFLLGVMLYIFNLATSGFTMVLGLSGLGTGIMQKKGKVYSLAGFLFAGIFGIFIADSSLLQLETLFSVASAAILFFFMPDNFYFNTGGRITSSVADAEDYVVRIKDLVSHRLNSFADTFRALSKTLNGTYERKTSLSPNDISKLMANITSEACVGCPKSQKCNDNNYYEMYQAIFCLLSAAERKGSAVPNDLPLAFSSSCENAIKFADIACRMIELYKVNMEWNNRVSESKELVSEQLYCVSDIIRSLADELDFGIAFKQDLEEDALTELVKNGVDIESIVIAQNNTGKYEVTISQKACYSKKSCNKSIIPTLNKILGVKMQKTDVECLCKKDMCNLHLSEMPKFKAKSGISRLTKSGSRETGDSYSFMELKNGQCLVALSDGMGSGERAKAESIATVELLEQLIESGFDKELAVKMINSVLVLKSIEDNFSTLDICSIDLYTGKVEFAKIGAAPTFLLRNGIVSVIKSSTLPVGILKDIDMDVSVKTLQENDVIVMVTDGVTELRPFDRSKGEWLVELLGDMKNSGPQAMADYILENAEKMSRNVIQDDMTVLVVKVSKV
ncbi:MAG: stage II sporulation protein E [Defluviitaleaceae bacterium]|nr:stage II sporulation protein E [Defluviitaleaceae bacterium]